MATFLTWSSSIMILKERITSWSKESIILNVSPNGCPLFGSSSRLTHFKTRPDSINCKGNMFYLPRMNLLDDIVAKNMKYF